MFLTKMELAVFSDRQKDLIFRSFYVFLVWFAVSVNKKEIKSRCCS